MTNIDRAAEIIYQKTGDPYLVAPIVKVLEDAGLLMPDLSEPDDPTIPEWEMPTNKHHAVSVSRYGTVRIWGDTSGYTPAEAREIAAALISAAAFVEDQENQND